MGDAFQNMANAIKWIWDNTLGWIIEKIWGLLKIIGRFLGFSSPDIDMPSYGDGDGDNTAPPGFGAALNGFMLPQHTPYISPEMLAAIPVASSNTHSPQFADNRQTNIGDVHIHTPATDVEGIASGARSALSEQLNDGVYTFDSNVKQP